MKVLIISNGHEVVVVQNEEEARRARESTAYDRTVHGAEWERGSGGQSTTNVVSFPGGSRPDLNQGLNDQVEALEEGLVNEAMAKTGQNQVKAAKLLRISRGALQHKLKKFASKIRQAA